MLGKTHMMAGVCASAAVLTYLHAPHVLYPVGLAVGAAAALLPDIDEPKSTVNKYIPVIGPAIGRTITHRGITHTIVAVVGLLLLIRGLWPAVPIPILAAIGAGYVSHLITDSITPEGIPWFWPFPWRITFTGWMPYPISHIFHTGGMLELVFWRAAFVLGAIWFAAMSFFPGILPTVFKA